ncbi:heparinase [Pedobacter sp. KBW01]|uniref:heparin-sulfate lyase HepC n=1 Tax=Pedobacter sp. KBW01 TaxID=2153364 RepID=UPI000F5B435F|nr:heparin-sulfate lyase HepC [Pedobacter sp. KBW01]RQO77101.1 heparinase [Pedobacter sp. KBW01]
MMLKKLLLTACLFCLSGVALYAQEQPLGSNSFGSINLSHPGLENVAKAMAKNDYEKAATQLLAYFRKSKAALSPGQTTQKVNPNTQQLADDILLHKFKPHKGYGTFDYGKDINWQFRPVKDQLLNTFLHRTTFWESLGTVYLATGDERYAKEWVFEVQDWINKNKQGAYADDKDYAWKAFVVSFRLNNWATFFNQFINSPNFTPKFLLAFLNAYNEQANYVMANYTDMGNHRLYEAEHLLLAGTSFPEFNQANTWRKSGITVLNAEITKQVYPDGVQFELSPSYHIGTISTFLRALKMAKDAGTASDFPQSYRNLVEKMCTAVPKFSFPDYTFPLYGNSFITNKTQMMKNYQAWAEVFPGNSEIAYFATGGKSGAQPAYLSSALNNAGFYAFRNGWDQKATVMQIKAGPPAEFHSHPDNGNFVLWVKGRNFTPDAGSFIYANVGNQENSKRDWYRSTKAHQTLMLDDKTIENNAKLIKWQPVGDVQELSYSNPGYKGLDHQRTFLFIDQSYFIIIDKANGALTGKLGIHYVLGEDAKAVVDKNNLQFNTAYADGNNLSIQVLNKTGINLKEEESFVSYEYQKEAARLAFVFEQEKLTGKLGTFVSLVMPYTGTNAPKAWLKENAGNNFETGKIDLTLTINGKEKTIKQQL